MSAQTTESVLVEIRAWMARRDMSQSELARRLGVTSPWVNKRLHEVVPISVDDLIAIAGVLDVSPMTSSLTRLRLIPSCGQLGTVVSGREQTLP